MFHKSTYDPLNDEYPKQCVVRHNLSSVHSRTRYLTINDTQDMYVVKSILIKCQFNIIFINRQAQIIVSNFINCNVPHHTATNNCIETFKTVMCHTGTNNCIETFKTVMCHTIQPQIIVSKLLKL
jgi:hypothetical protein